MHEPDDACGGEDDDEGEGAADGHALAEFAADDAAEDAHAGPEGVEEDGGFGWDAVLAEVEDEHEVGGAADDAEHGGAEEEEPEGAGADGAADGPFGVGAFGGGHWWCFGACCRGSVLVVCGGGRGFGAGDWAAAGVGEEAYVFWAPADDEGREEGDGGDHDGEGDEGFAESGGGEGDADGGGHEGHGAAGADHGEAHGSAAVADEPVGDDDDDGGFDDGDGDGSSGAPGEPELPGLVDEGEGGHHGGEDGDAGDEEFARAAAVEDDADGWGEDGAGDGADGDGEADGGGAPAELVAEGRGEGAEDGVEEGDGGEGGHGDGDGDPPVGGEEAEGSAVEDGGGASAALGGECHREVPFGRGGGAAVRALRWRVMGARLAGIRRVAAEGAGRSMVVRGQATGARGGMAGARTGRSAASGVQSLRFAAGGRAIGERFAARGRGARSTVIGTRMSRARRVAASRAGRSMVVREQVAGALGFMTGARTGRSAASGVQSLRFAAGAGAIGKRFAARGRGVRSTVIGTRMSRARRIAAGGRRVRWSVI